MTLALVPKPVSLSVVSQAHLIESDGLGQGPPQHVQVRRLIQGQPVAQPGVDLHRLGEQLRPPAPRLDPSVAGLEGAGDAGRAFQGPVVTLPATSKGSRSGTFPPL